MEENGTALVKTTEISGIRSQLARELRDQLFGFNC